MPGVDCCPTETFRARRRNLRRPSPPIPTGLKPIIFSASLPASWAICREQSIHLRKAVVLDPTLATAHYNLGIALWYGGQKPESITELHTALQLDPGFGEAYSFLGMASGQTGDLDGGRRYLDRAISLNPDLPGPHIDLGIILLKTGQSKAAFEQFQSVVNEDGNKNQDQADQIPDLELAITAVQEAIHTESRRPPGLRHVGTAVR